MTPDRFVRLMSLVAALWASLTYSASADSRLPLLVLLPLVFAGWLLGGGVGGRRVPIHRGILTGAVVAVLAYAGLRVLREGPTVDVFSESVMLLLAAKLADHRRSRDTSQIVALSVFLVIGSILTSNSLLVGVMVLVMLPIGAGLVLSFQLAAAAERATGAGLGAGQPAFERGTGRGLASLITGITIVGVMLSVVVFVALPRGLGRSAFGQWGGAAVGREVGFNDEVQLGTAGLISENQTPVLDVQLFDRSGLPLGSRDDILYLRGAVLDVYAGGRWSPGPRDRDREGARADTAVLIGSSERPIDDWDVEIRVTVRAAPSGASPLFTVLEPRRMWLDAPSGLLVDRTTGVVTRAGGSGKVGYRLTARDRHYETPTDPNPVRPPVGFPSEAVREYTEMILREGGIDPDPATRPRLQDFAASRRIEDALSRMDYTLDIMAPPPGQDAIEWFLLEHREGHCEYFASAMAAMCRSVGIPARVVTGYVATDFHDLTGHYVVRQSNAHAWVEVHLDGERLTGAGARWRRFDPTPSADFREIHQPAETMFSGLRRLIDSIEFAWVVGVVGFDDEARSSIFGNQASGRQLEDWGGNLVDRMSIGGRGLIVRALLAGVLAFGVVLALGLGLVLGSRPAAAFLARLWVRLLSGSHERAGWGDLAAVRRQVLSELKRAGASKPPSVPLLAHVREAGPAALGAEQAGRFEAVVEELYLARFAGQDAARDRARSRLKQALAGAGGSGR